MVDDDRSAYGPRPSRRALARGVAWTTPALVVSAAAPAFAVSMECAPQTASQIQSALAFEDGLPRYTQKRDPASVLNPAPQVRFEKDYYGAPNVVAMFDDPPNPLFPPSKIATTLTSTSICVGRGTYNIAFYVLVYNANPRNVTLNTRMLNADTSATLVSGPAVQSTDTSSRDITTRSVTLTFSVPERTRIALELVWSFDPASGGLGRTGDDIGVTSPKVTKTA
jgi:hypothetical protein